LLPFILLKYVPIFHLRNALFGEKGVDFVFFSDFVKEKDVGAGVKII